MQFMTMLFALSQVALGYHTGPDATARLVLDDLTKNVAEHERPFTRYLSNMHIDDVQDLLLRQRYGNFWNNTMSVYKAIALMKVVPGSGGALLRINIENYGWNTPAWRTVATREPYHREPWINNIVAKAVRDLIGERQDQKTDHIFAVVRADWFFRETAETDRSPSYYDLLYAKFRFINVGEVVEFGKQKTGKVKKIREVGWKGGIWPNDGKYYPAWPQKGSFRHQEEYEEDEVTVIDLKLDNGSTHFKFVDFPKNKAEWDKAWNLDSGLFLKEAKFKTANGAVAIGMGDDEKRGSGVARNNRLVLVQGHPNCIGGSTLESFDVLDPTGERDFVQNAPFLAQGKFKFDAQELLISLPNGAQAAFLTANDLRVETADPKVAIDSDKLDRRVRTPGSCVVCHAPSYGVIPPINVVKDFLGANGKTDIFFKNKQLQKDFEGFFFDWEQNIQPVLQAPYKSMIDRSTFYGKEKAWTGADIAKYTALLRQRYDQPLNLKAVCLETGMTEAELRLVAAESPLIWINVVLRGETIPRRVWEKDVFPELMKLWTLYKLKPIGEKRK